MEYAIQSLGLKERLNSVIKFDDLMKFGRRDEGGTTTIIPPNPTWLGQPYIFRVPYIDYREDKDNGGQRPVISILDLKMYQLYTSKAVPWLVFEALGDNRGYYVVEKVIEGEYAGLKLSMAAIKVGDGNNRHQISGKAPFLTLMCTDDVEALLSTWFTTMAASHLYIGRLSRYNEDEEVATQP